MGRHRWMVLLGLVAVAMLGRGARAGTASVDLTCWAGVATANTDWATANSDVTDATTLTHSVGWLFDDAATYGPQIECSFHVPDDYDDAAGSPPEVQVSGWSIANDNCSGTEYVRIAVTSRAFSAESLADAWPSETVASLGFTCVVNGCSGIDCNKKDLLKSTNIDVTSAASNWNIRDLVFVRIRRDTPDSGDSLSQDFHLARATLLYPTTH